MLQNKMTQKLKVKSEERSSRQSLAKRKQMRQRQCHTKWMSRLKARVRRTGKAISCYFLKIHLCTWQPGLGEYKLKTDMATGKVNKSTVNGKC